jgi:Telomere recombination
MARYFDIHPASPQRRAIAAVADIVRAGGVIAYPTDSCYALGCQLGNTEGITRIRSHHLTLVCQDFAQLGQFAIVPMASRPARLVKGGADSAHHVAAQPRPMNGIAVGNTVRYWTLASNGIDAIISTASATRCTDMTGSAANDPSPWRAGG